MSNSSQFQSDAGTYSIEARNDNGTTTLHFYLSISGLSTLPDVYHVSVPDSVLQGETVTLECGVGGSPVPDVYWYFINTLISSGGTVELMNVTSVNSGNYECRGVNNLGTDSATRYLRVRGAPRVNAIVSPLVTSLGSTATLQVYIDVDPYSNPLETEIIWSRSDGKLIDSRVSYEDNMKKLVIYNCLASDAGVYVVRVSNPKFNYGETKILLEVTKSPELSSPTLKKTARLGGAATFHVVVDSLPRPDPSLIRWTHNMTQVLLTGKSHDGMSLTLTDIRASNAGRYRFHYLNSYIEMNLYVEHVPHIYRRSEDYQTVAATEDAIFFCSFTGYPRPTVRWFGGYSELFSTNPRYDISPDGETLKIRNAQTLDSTVQYRCEVSNKVGSDTASFSISVSTLPILTALQNTIDIDREGSSVTLQVTISGLSTTADTTLIWTSPFGTEIFVSSGRYTLSNKKRKLTIPNVRFTDAGTYTCNLYTESGTISQTIRLRQHDPRPAVKVMNDVRVSAGSTATVIAYFQGSAATAQWFKDNVALSTNYKYQVTSRVETQELTIRSTTLSDSGDYSLLLSNFAGSDSASASLDVVATPEFELHPSTQLLNSGDTAVLSCSLRSSVTQVIKLVWKLGLDGISLEINGQDLGLIGGPYLVKQEADKRSSTLVVNNFSELDPEQDVWCEAGNWAGTSLSNRAKLLSKSKGVYLPSIILLSHPEGIVVVNIGEEVTIQIKCYGTPDTIQWTTSPNTGRVLQLSHDNTVLFLPGVSSDDAVSYTVTAANSHGTRSLTFKVVVRSGLQSGEVILPVYDEISAQVGGTVKIRVLILNPTFLNLYNLVWSRDGVSLFPSNRYTFSPTTNHVTSKQAGTIFASLSINSVVLTDSGIYQVYFSGSYYRSAAGETRLKVTESDSIATSPDSIATDTGIYSVLTRVTPLQTSVYLGSAITLQVSAPPEIPADRILWSKVSGRLPLSRVRYQDNRNTLVLTGVTLEDAGTYRVSADRTNSIDFYVSVLNSDTASNRGQLNGVVSVSPVNSFVYVKLGATATLSVTVSSTDSLSTLDVRWEKCNKIGQSCGRITHGRDLYFNYRTQLRIQTVSGGDDGVYRCHVTGADQITKTGDITLFITGSNIIVTPERSKITAEIGQQVVMLVTVSGVSSLNSRDITWTKNGETLRSDRFTTSFYTAPYRSSVVCQNIFLNEAGSYIVSVSNSEGSGYAEIVLGVLDTNSIELITSDLNLREGQTAIFQVIINVKPTPLLSDIEWQKDSFPINSNPTSDKYQFSVDRKTLSVFSVTPHDAGHYRCRIRNTVYVSNSNHLSVIENLSVRALRPTVYSGYEDDVTLSIIVMPAAAYTEGTIDWFKDGNSLNFDGRVTKSRWGRTVSISNVTEGDIGGYLATVSYDGYKRSTEILLRYYNGVGIKVEAVQGDVQARYGSFPTLKVTIQSDPHPNLEEIVWYKGDLNTEVSGERFTVGGKGTELSIALARKGDYTSYTCRVKGGESLCISCQDCTTGSCDKCCATVTLSLTEQSTESVSAVPSKALYTATDEIVVQFTMSDGSYTVTQLTWYKGVYPITTGGRYTVDEAAKTLKISNSDAGDNGVYAVVYETRKSGSEAAGIAELTVKVLGEPKVTVTPETALVTEGSDVTFTCTAAASSSSLVYKWEKNSAVIAGQTDYRLTITDAQHENAAKYKCTVTFTENGQDYTSSSIAYLVINDDVTLEVLTPFVLADVTNSSPSLSFKVTSRSQGSVTNGMKVTWYKDNSVLQEGNGITFSNSRTNLMISNPTSANEGNYRVLVELTTLTLEGSMQLAVTSALPTVKYSETTYVGRSGEQLIVNIEVGGNPVPEVNQIEWYLNNVRLYQGDENVRFSDNYLTLYRSKMTSAEAGQVKVAVETSAGRVEEVAEVVVIQQNDIQETKSSENQLLGKSLSLKVDFHMMPLPVEQNVQWTRDSEILTDTDSRIEFYNSGQELLIKDVTVDDAGRYTVTVNKPGGSTVNKDLLVNIRNVADKLTFSTSPGDVIVDEGSKAVISCDVSGTPSAEIKFEYKDGTQIKNEGRFYVTASSLEIWAARVTDTAEYKCIADNGDETISELFKVTVNQRITIKAEATSVPATIGGTAKFTVSVSPTNAKVTWTRQGVLFPESDGGHYDVEVVGTYTDSGINYRKEVLTISRVQSTDLGSYEATASYSDHRYVSKVELKLTNAGTSVVSITASTRNTEVYEGENAKFTCDVSIDSTISWTKNGVDVTALDDSIKDRYVLANSNEHLTIEKAVEGDQGLYMCHVTSANSGSDQASATLTVLEPIRITEYPTHMRLLVGTGANFLLSVKVETGADSKTISWQLDDTEISGDTEMIQQDVPLAAGTKKYTVTARLASWLDNTNVDPAVANIYVTTYSADQVQEAVIIQAPEDQTAILGSTVTFECVAFGIPDPTVRWSNGSSDMATSFFTNKYTERGVESKLVITNVNAYYQGEYRCKADNGISSMEIKSAYMELINPPSIKLIDSVFYGVPGRELVIKVDVDYQNAVLATMTKWYRNGEAIVAEPGKIVFSSDGTALTIVNVESSSAGTYSFTIETEAGSASTSTKLEIISAYIPPTVTIPQFFTEVVAYRGSVYFLKCTVDGKPAPKVSWKKTNNEKTEVYKVQDDTLPYSVQPDSSMRIASVTESDNGTWTCVAESQPEQVLLTTEKSLELLVVDWLYRPFVYPYHGHKIITVVSGDTLEVNIEVMYRHPIRSHNIVWKRLDFDEEDWEKATELNMVDPGYDNVVSFARNRRQLMVAGISKMFEGYYRAYVKTIAGDADTIIEVYVISRVSPNIRFLDTIGDEYYTVNGEQDFVFNVNVTGEPFPKEISWYKKTGQIFKGLHNGTIENYVYTIGYYGDMHLQRPDKSSSGYYKIQVIPEKGGEDQMEEKSVLLNVADFYLGFHTIPYVGGIKEIGTAVTMTCSALGVPNPETVTWYKGIEKLDNTKNELIIKSVKKESKGDYYCVASNNYGVIYSPRVSLQVQYLDSEFEPITCMKKESVDGVVTVTPCTTSNIIEGDVVTLSCNGPDGWPFPKTTWFFNDNPITNNVDGLSPAPNQYGDLIFPFAQPKDSGNYGCTLTNDEGSKSNYHDNYVLKVAPSDDTSVDNAKTSEWLIQPGTNDVTVAEHTPVTIACMVSSFPEPSYEWTFENEVMTSIPIKRELSFGKRLLTFNLIEQAYGGKYACKTWVMKDNKKQEQKTAEFTLIVASRPSFVNVPIFQIGKVGDETEIDLGTPQGTPVPTIVWSFNGEGVQLGGRINVVDGRRLRIDPTLNEDQGIWQATATNKAGSAQHAIYLKIQEALEFTASPSSLTGQDAYVPQFETARFPCTVRGTPGPQIYKWYRQKHLRDPFNGLPARAYMDEDKSLIIPFTQKWDNGTYVCSVTNEYFEEIEGSVMLKVVEPPTIVTPPQDVNIQQFGDESTLSCLCEPQAVAIQSCVVDWRRDGKTIVDDQTSVKVVDYVSVLTILQTREKHIGQYECHGTNNIGSVSAFAYITKSFTPFLSVKPPGTLTASSQSSVSLECLAIGFPPMNYLWTLNKIPLDLEDTRFQVTDTGTLVIDGVISTDAGTFTCFASNPYGQASASTVLTVEGQPIRPPAPWISSIAKDNNNLFTVTVKIDTSSYTSSSITNLILTLRNTESGQTTTKPTSATTESFENLEAKPYTVSVVVQNEFAASESSIPSGIIDLADYEELENLTMPVSNVGVKDNNKYLAWDLLTGADSYKIYHNKVNTADGRTFLGSTTEKQIAIDDSPSLEPFTEYYFQVVPIKNGKEGLYSKPLLVRTQASVPVAPVITGFMNTTVAGEIIVQFDRKWTHASGIPKNFMVYYEQGYQLGTKQGTLNREKRQTVFIEAGSAAVNVRIPGLTAGEQYSFTMIAQNELTLQSERSAKVTQQTKTGLPGIPTITDRDGSGRDAILVKWSAPTVTNGRIEGYYVYYRLSNSFNDVAAKIEVPPTQLYQNVTGLEEGTEDERTIYEIAVSAFTEAGEGEKSSWEEARTRPKSIPNKMQAPTVNVINWHTIEVIWELHDDGLTGIDTFTIYLNSQIDGGEGSSYRIPNRNDRWARITTLDEDTSYTLSIVATNWKGSSDRSNQNSFRTPKKPVYLRVWVAGTITACVVFLLMVFFLFLFIYFIIFKKQPLKEERKTPIPYIQRDGGNHGQRPVTKGSLVLNNPVAGPPQGSERYSSRNSRQDNYRPEDVRMSDLRARQPSDNCSYNSGGTNSRPPPKKYDDDGYAPSFADSYNDKRYDDDRSYDDRYYGNEDRRGYGNDRYGTDRGRYNDRDRYNNQYDDDRYSSTDNQRTMPRDLVGDDGFVIDNPSAARFSQI